MINKKLSVTIALGLELLSCFSCFSLKAQESKKLYRFATPSSSISSQEEQENEQNVFEPPPEEATPKQTTGGGSRNDSQCSANSNWHLPLTALVPPNGLGLTLKERPTLPVYLPVTTAKHLELSLFDANHRGIYQTQIRLPAQAQVVGIKLPQEAPALRVKQEYYWSVAMICDPSDRLKDRVVKGRIKRIQLEDAELEQRLELAANRPLQQVAIYRKAGMWYDMVASLLNYRKIDPHNGQINIIWRDLLAYSGLDLRTTKQRAIK